MQAFNGETYYLEEVVAFILCHLKERLLAHLSKSARFSSTDFEWVITVPAIWNAEAKQMMREAAYMVLPTNVVIIANILTEHSIDPLRANEIHLSCPPT